MFLTLNEFWSMSRRHMIRIWWFSNMPLILNLCLFWNFLGQPFGFRFIMSRKRVSRIHWTVIQVADLKDDGASGKYLRA